jgi:hypothetical protein
MRYCVLVAAMLMSAAPGGISQAADNQLTPQERAAGWLLLFDGKTFTNWAIAARRIFCD